MEMEDPQNGYIFDPESAPEMARLINLDRAITEAMGGPLAGIDEKYYPHLTNILDMACGPGGWVLDAAFNLPHTEVAGVDISRIMVEYAHARARTQQLANASFGVMDMTQPLDFADGAFDLVNARYLVGVLKREEWPRFLNECLRLLRPGGLLRLTESDGFETTSPALTQLHRWLMHVMHRKQYGFSCDGATLGITPVLPSLMRQAGIHKPMKNFFYGFDGSSDGPWHMDWFRMAEITYTQAIPLIVKAQLTTEEAALQQYKTMLTEMLRTDFCCLSSLRCVVGVKEEVHAG
jgi:SAM-dependent methyltransferase